jgi:hypothetical protein
MRSEDATWGLAIVHLAACSPENVRSAMATRSTSASRPPPIRASQRSPCSLPWSSTRADYINVLGEPEGAARADGVHIAGMYTIHDRERAFIHAEGLEAFWKLGWGPYDPLREPGQRDARAPAPPGAESPGRLSGPPVAPGADQWFARGRRGA